MQTQTLRDAATNLMMAAACLSSPGLMPAAMSATQAHNVSRQEHSSSLHAAGPSRTYEPDFLDHLQRGLGLDRETALATLGEALLRYEPLKPRRA